ncbi:myelin protein P0-like [Lethenteron reissneri]|uniref:myelin protein P0-like n=1 Tax=Lethenteron reissneri TaxID=7753 RepID=UPI002AB6DB4C|nr:myelin protein P0-like [Lethenteron reissneri]XP_061434541.1 myelin protein P0-like [Lethenteron reissneri]
MATQTRPGLTRTFGCMAMKRILYSFCLLLSVQALVVQTPSKVTVQSGETAFLSCHYTCNTVGVTDTVVRWWRDSGSVSKKVLGNDGSIRRYNPRAEWHGSTESCKASITIASVETSDAGSYKCDVLLLPMYDEGQSSLQLWVSNRPEGTAALPTATSSNTALSSWTEAPPTSVKNILVIVPVSVILIVVIIVVAWVTMRQRRMKKKLENEAQSMEIKWL